MPHVSNTTLDPTNNKGIQFKRKRSFKEMISEPLITVKLLQL